MLVLPGSLSLATFSRNVSGSERNAMVTDFEPFTNYGCYVSARTSIGEGNTSDAVFQTTDEFSKLGTAQWNLRIWTLKIRDTIEQRTVPVM